MNVTIIAQRGASALVEYRDPAGALHRVYVPTQTLTLVNNAARDETNGAEIEQDELDAGIPYGDAWESMPIGNVGAERIAQELRNRNIWTKADVTRNIAQVRAALAAAYANDLTVLLTAARES